MNLHAHLIGTPQLWSLIFMSVSYLMYFTADALIVKTSFERRAYGQAPVPAGILFGSALAALIGPFTDQRHLFPYGLHDRSYLLVVWVLSLTLQAIIFAQYFKYSSSIPARYRWHAGLLSAAAAFLFSWFFIAFYQDLYVNEIFAIATFLMAVGYAAALAPGSELKGMPVSGAWLYTGAITFAELGTWVNSMDAAYPEAKPEVRERAIGEIARLRDSMATGTDSAFMTGDQIRAAARSPDAGYTFIYFLWIAASILMAWYSWSLWRRARAGRPNDTGRA